MATLAGRAIAGDHEAVGELLAELEPLVVRTARLVAGSGSWAAEDAAQEALLDIARGVQRLREPRAVKSWALRVATRRAIRVSRRERLLALRRSPHLQGELVAEGQSERASAIKEAFDLLPPRLRATAVLRLHAGLSEEETAQVLGCSIGTIKSNLHDARARLSNTLRDRGFAPTTTAKEAV